MPTDSTFLTLLPLLIISLAAIAAVAWLGWLEHLKQRSASPTAGRVLSAAPVSPMSQWPRLATVARWNLFTAVFVVVVLAICTPLPWLLFGNAGMPGVRLSTICLLLAVLYTVVSVAIMIAISGTVSHGPVSPGPARSDETPTHADLVARITHRFCPCCRAPLAADAPEGLCPACLLAGGLGSAAVDPVEAGLAVTTPPHGESRSDSPTMGDVADLAGRLPQLEILELLGRGGMGSVYKARQKHLDRIIALKVIPPEATKDPAFAERFAREARALARLNHPNIIAVYDFGQVGDLYYLLMEYVDGVNLRQALRASRLAPPEALAIVPQICDALQYAHDQGVVHRDIKPENVLLDRSGRVKIADFGLAKILGKGPDDFTLTGTQQIMGTPRYMAPEQIEKPAAVDHRADIYSLGVVIYEMLTGELPLGRFEPPSHKVQLDVRIDQVVLRTLEKEPDRRYQRASQVKTDLATAAPPVWQAPAPAIKQLGDSPLSDALFRQTLAVAIGMVLGVLVMTGGLAAGIYGQAGFPPFSGAWWGFMGAALGCIVGGFGSVAGSYNTYRQMAGAEDLMKSPRTTWFDWTIRGYLLFGLALLAGGFFSHFRGAPSLLWQPLLAFACLVVFQAGLFLIYRLLLRPTAGAFMSSEPLGLVAPPQLPSLAAVARAGGTMLRNFARSKSDTFVGGVCGGLGESTPMPAWCWRMLFLVLIFGYGVGGLIYFVIWICVPEAAEDRLPPPASGPLTAWLRRFARSRQDVAVGGVCGGLGEHTALPAWCWRVIFVLLTISFGAGVVPYLLLWICVPESASAENGAPSLDDPAISHGENKPSGQARSAQAEPQSGGSSPGRQILVWLLVLAGIFCLILCFSFTTQTTADGFSFRMGFPDAWLVWEPNKNHSSVSGVNINRWSVAIGVAAYFSFWGASRLTAR